jgi:hypothetical protein
MWTLEDKTVMKLISILFLTCFAIVSAYSQLQRPKNDETRGSRSITSGDLKISISTVANDDSVFAPFGKTPTLKTTFSFGEEIIVYVTATNQSQKKITVTQWDYFEPLLPHLELNSQTFKYVEDKQPKALRDIDQRPLQSSAFSIEIGPGETKAIGFVRLSEWYRDCLRQGIYRLRVSYQTLEIDKEIWSDTFSFEIVK